MKFSFFGICLLSLLFVTSALAQDSTTGKGEGRPTGTTRPTTIVAPVVASTGGACEVSTDARDSAQMRVGPGTNRGVIAFLPANVDVPVTGRFEEDDGDVWYQVDKAVAMPGTAANELWVDAEQVEAVGDCETIEVAAAPPVIPGAVVAPPATGNTPAPGNEPVVAGLVIPVAGTWTFRLNPTSDASCVGTSNFRIASADVWVDSSDVRGYLSASGNGSTLNFDFSTPLTRTPGTNSYYGTFSFDDGTNTQIYLTAVNSSLLTGQMVGNITFDGIACSATTAVTLSRG